MLSRYRNLLSVICLLALFPAHTTVAAVPIPAPPSVAASGHLLIDFDSGRILSEHNSEQRLEPASLTKIMTAYVVLRELKAGNIQLSDKVLISKKAWQTPGSRMFIEVDKEVSVEQLLKGMIIQSGNDASVALAEHIAGSEETFANLMNNHAHRLGMLNSHFVNSTGLPDENHYTTPRDIVKVSEATIREFPEYYPWYAQLEYEFNGIKQHNRNQLLWRDKSVDGVKTGHTEAAGYCLVASAQRESMRLTSVVMGTSSEDARAKESLSLLNYGFRFFETHRLYDGGATLSRTRVWKGGKESLELGLEKALYVTIPRNQYANLKATLNIDAQRTAPIIKGQALGSVEVALGDETISSVPLIALEQIDEGGIFQILKDTILLWFE
ncbi:MAG: D-alanyl-D-alanine carboxypeptidase [Chromatiaceae bacterium]|nr:D-alanyl-D-alanine carboxypeptidase [Chromatiaceae bacterium]MCP5408668.1 D-alanyl-D-alanine carboxypeptidase [Chromatiaceae bacterium]MCP5442631.1 D-alanyl-D-alanine carboxypeptidase [Chromatiaceae bacterium]